MPSTRVMGSSAKTRVLRGRSLRRARSSLVPRQRRSSGWATRSAPGHSRAASVSSHPPAVPRAFPPKTRRSSSASQRRSVTRSSSRQRLVGAGSACSWPRTLPSFREQLLARPNVRARRSAMVASIWSATSIALATSRCRSWPTSRGASSHWASGSAAFNAATKRSSRSRRLRLSLERAASSGVPSSSERRSPSSALLTTAGRGPSSSSSTPLGKPSSLK